jgi:hypothetical protein
MPERMTKERMELMTSLADLTRDLTNPSPLSSVVLELVDEIRALQAERDADRSAFSEIAKNIRSAYLSELEWHREFADNIVHVTFPKLGICKLPMGRYWALENTALTIAAKERDEALARAEKAEAACAVMRAVLEDALTPCRYHFQCHINSAKCPECKKLLSAISTDADTVLLTEIERMRTALETFGENKNWHKDYHTDAIVWIGPGDPEQIASEGLKK